MIEPHLWFNWLKIFFFVVSAENHRWTSKGKILNYLLNWYLSKQKLFQETRLNQFLQYIGNNQKNEEELVRILWSYQSHIFIILYEKCMICHHIQFGCHIWYLSLLILWEEEWPYRVILGHTCHTWSFSLMFFERKNDHKERWDRRRLRRAGNHR